MTSIGWPPERIEELRAHAATGATASQIATAMHATREAITGQCTRRSIPLGREANGFGRAATRPKAPRAPRPERNGASDDAARFEEAPMPAADAWLPLSGTEPVSLLALHDGKCPWPIEPPGHSGPMMYCGVGKALGQPYCRAHARLAYRRGSAERPPREVRDLVKLARLVA